MFWEFNPVLFEVVGTKKYLSDSFLFCVTPLHLKMNHEIGK